MKRAALILLAGTLAWGAERFHSQAAGTSNDPALSQWWSEFHDAELDSLIERAVRANLDLKIAASRVMEARAARGVAKSALLPSVEASNTQRRVRGITPGVALPDSNFIQSSLDASWELDLFGGKRHALDAATADAAAAEEARRGVELALLGDVARAYADLRGTERRLDIAEQNIRLQSDSLALTRTRADAGLGADLDVERQSAQLAQTQAIVPALESAKQVSIHRLSVLLGEEPASLEQELTAAAPLPSAPPVVPVGLQADLIRRRPDIRRVDAETAAAAARVGVAKSDFFPKILLTGTAGRQGASFSGLTLGAGNFFALGPAIQLPIFTGGRLKANLAAAKERFNQSQTEYRATVLRALEETENALTAYGREQERQERLQASAASSRLATHLANELYTRGLADFLTVLDAQREQLAIEDQLAQSDTAVVTNLVTLYKSLGGGWN